MQSVEPSKDQRRSGTRSKMNATARPGGGGQIWQQLGMTTHGGQLEIKAIIVEIRFSIYCFYIVLCVHVSLQVK